MIQLVIIGETRGKTFEDNRKRMNENEMWNEAHRNRHVKRGVGKTW